MALSLVAPTELGLVSSIQKAQDEKAQSEAAHAASDADTNTASVSIALLPSKMHKSWTDNSTVQNQIGNRARLERIQTEGRGELDAMIGTLAAFLLITALAGVGVRCCVLSAGFKGMPYGD